MVQDESTTVSLRFQEFSEIHRKNAKLDSS